MNVRPKFHDNPSSSSNSRIYYSYNMHFSGSVSLLCLSYSVAGFAKFVKLDVSCTSALGTL